MERPKRTDLPKSAGPLEDQRAIIEYAIKLEEYIDYLESMRKSGSIGLSSDVVGQSEQLPPKCIEGFDDDKFCDNSDECEWCKGLVRR